jgi:hypothetical protein
MVNPMVNNINKRGKPIFGMKKNWINGSTGFVILLAQQKRLRIWIRWIIRFPWNSEQKKLDIRIAPEKLGGLVYELLISRGWTSVLFVGCLTNRTRR